MLFRSVLVLMAFDPEYGRWIIGVLLVGPPALVGGWFLVRNRVTATAAEFSAEGAVGR